jgi:hypothetical protein
MLRYYIQMSFRRLRIKLIRRMREMSCNNIFYISGVNNSSVAQQDTKVFDNQNFKNQESVMHTMNKYNDEVILT